MLTLEVLDTVGAAIGSGVLRTTCESDLTGGHTVHMLIPSASFMNTAITLSSWDCEVLR